MKWVVLSLVIRLLVLTLGVVNDSSSELQLLPVKYGDIDYDVYTDAADYIVKGKSPYERQTYRYPPILAQLLTVNIFVGKAAGKVLFVVVDILCGIVLYSMSISDKDRFLTRIFWFLNPVVINISTRGNADSIVLLPILLSLSFLVKQKPNCFSSGLFLGIAIYLRLFPVIYIFNCVFYLMIVSTCWKDFLLKFSAFGSSVVATVSILIYIGYCQFGSEYLWASYGYHYGRIDHRHNLSSFFLPSYLGSSVPGGFLPQLLSIVVVSFRFRSAPEFSWFVSTMLFVSLNKVITIQYFSWYFALAPLALRYVTMSTKIAVSILIIWVLTLLNWLFWAFLLEFRARDVFIPLWISSLLFLFGNTTVILSVIYCYSNPVKVKNE